MTIEGNTLRWIYVRWADSERLYRARLIGRQGESCLPGREEVLRYERLENGSIVLHVEGATRTKSFVDRDVLVRHRADQAPVRASQMSSAAVQRTLSYLLLLVLGFGFSGWKFLPTLDRVAEEPRPQVSTSDSVRKKAPISAPMSRSLPTEPVVMNGKSSLPNGVLPKQKRIISSRPSVTSSLEKKMRTALVAGKLDLAEGFLFEAQQRAGRRLEAPFRNIAAEIRYARCRRDFSQRQWSQAVRSCEDAVRLANHSVAKKVLDQLGAQTKRLYLEGYVMETSNPEAALRRYREAVASAPVTSPYRSKALAKVQLTKVVITD